MIKKTQGTYAQIVLRFGLSFYAAVVAGPKYSGYFVVAPSPTLCCSEYDGLIFNTQNFT